MAVYEELGMGAAVLALLGAAPIEGARAADEAAQQPNRLSTVVITATRVEQASFDLPVSIDVVDAEAMQNGQPMVNAAEGLQRVPGIVATNQYRFSSDQQVSSRGFGARSSFGVRGVRLYADGIPQSMPDGQGQMGTFSLSSAARMEVLRGPFSALFGNSSGGVIQIFTRDGEGDPRLSGSAYAGSFDTWRVGVGAEGRQGALGYVVDVSRYQSEGYREHSAARRDHANAKLTWKLADDTKATLVLNALDQPYNQDPQGLTRAQMSADPSQTPANSITQNTGGSKSQTQGGLNIEQRLGANDTLRGVAWTGVRQTLGRLSIPLNTAEVIKGSGGISNIDRNFYGSDLRWTHRADTPTGALTLTLGLDYEYMKDVRTGYENNAGAIGVLRRDEDNIVHNFDQYLQAEWKVGADWILSGGLRHSRVTFRNDDRYIRTTGVGNPDDSGGVTYSNTSPVLGVVYHLSPTVNLYANAGKGFETPTFIELAYQANGASGLNFGLRPSTSRNVETGVKALVGRSTRINLALFEVRSEREIVVDASASGRTVYANAGRTQRRGLELSIDGRLLPELQATLSYSRLDATFADSYRSSTGTTILAGNQLPGTPRNTLYAELAWRHRASGFDTAIEARASSRVYVNDVNADAAAGYTVVNWRGGFAQHLGRVELKEFVRVENLADRRYVGGVLVNDANGRYFAPAAGRNFIAGINAAVEF
ncbi:MAG TPA: TonB-dependent receptor [Burkholderiaceae bacterium]|nr:TonB-dependent receptor [Burkholderiaceae bacterium]HMY98409.1 TonB-dependent receptor [Burkholderiaceae bacterium]HNB43469.1 TonB-dependent receptor [Burkholderiaceae bacterium]HNG78410.1 TonB-dependent receptor [Burkholderiaceae bacterium]